MSGLEVVGVALAVVSIVFSVLEDWDRVADKSQSWFRYENDFERVRDRLNLLKCRYKYLVQKVLILSDTEWVMIKADRSCLDAKELEVRLRQRVPAEEYDVYLKTIRALEEDMLKLRERLGLKEGATVVDLDGRELLACSTSSRRQFNFSFRERRRERLFSRIESLLSGLESLDTARDELMRSRTSTRNIVGPTPEQLSFWQQAHTFHLQMATIWSCMCRPTHCADLLLNPALPTDLLPRVLLWHDQRTGPGPRGPPGPWTARGVSLAMQLQPLADAIPHVPPANVLPTRGTARLDRWKRLTRSKLQKSPTTSSSTIVPTCNTPSRLVHVDDMCKLFASFSGDCQGLLTGAQPAVAFRALQAMPSVESVDMTSLATLMQLSMAGRPKRPHRLRIAATLTSSLISLHADCWIHDHCTAENVVFRVRNGVCEIKQPYLRRSHNASSSTSSRPNFVPLGLLLVRICFGATLEESEIGKAWPFADARADDDEALLWHDLVDEDIGPDYAQAVKWCLSSHDGHGLDFDQNLEAEFFREVVTPVQRSLDYYMRSSSRH